MAAGRKGFGTKIMSRPRERRKNEVNLVEQFCSDYEFEH